MSAVYTSQQIENWRAYEAVRVSGAHNMLSHAARLAAGLTSEQHLFVIKNYAELKAAAEKEQE